MDINRIGKSGIKDALSLVWDVFQEFEAPDYAQEGIDTFHDFIKPDSILEKMERKEILFWSCMMGSSLAGVLAVRNDNHICLLFVRREFQRQGIARKLFLAAEEYCRSLGLKNMTVNSSPYAVEAYRRLGFKDLAMEQTMNGIRYTPMEYAINI
ncbi:MAG: GNAT family N-acetyltransferase [Eubacteriales bacterium]